MALFLLQCGSAHSLPFHLKEDEFYKLSQPGTGTSAKRAVVSTDLGADPMRPIQLDPHVNYAESCLIVGYHVNGVPTGNTYAAEMFRHYQIRRDWARQYYGAANNSPEVQRVGNIQELVSAIARCPVGSTLVLATHGFGEYGGGFWLSEDPNVKDPWAAGIAVAARSENYTKMVDALAKRRMANVILHACEVGKQQATARLNDENDPLVANSLGNRMANDLYRKILSGLQTDAEKARFPKARVELYTEKVYGNASVLQAQIPGTKRLVFETDDKLVAELRPNLPAPETPRPQLAQNAPRANSPTQSQIESPQPTRNPAAVPAPQNGQPPHPVAEPPQAMPRPQVAQEAPQTLPRPTQQIVQQPNPIGQPATPVAQPYRLPAQAVPQSTGRVFGESSPSLSSPSSSVSSRRSLNSPQLAGLNQFGMNPFGLNNGMNGMNGLGMANGAAGAAGAGGTPGSPGGKGPGTPGSGGGRSNPAIMPLQPLPPIQVPNFGDNFTAQIIKPSLMPSETPSWLMEMLNSYSRPRL